MSEDRSGDAIAVGGDLSPATLVAAYSRGVFPMHIGNDLVWWSPARRGVLEISSFHAARSLHRARNRFHTTIDQAFADVVDGCADPRRLHGWINAEIRDAYIALHLAGRAHSLEVWNSDGALVGGLYGVAIGGLFAAESKFSRERDASKVALWHLVTLLSEAGGDRIIDVQWLTPHLQSLGCSEVSRAQYQARLATILKTPGYPFP